MMINGNVYGKTGNSAIKPRIAWTAVANEQGNYSDVTATLSYSRRDSYSTYGHWAGSITIDGNTKSRSGHYMVITKDSNTVAITHTVRVPHNDNGSRTVTISANGSIAGTTLDSTTISAEVMLENIPRAASIAACDGDIGSTVMVNIGKKSENHRYTVAYTFGKLSGYLTETGLSDKATYTQATCLAFPLPESFYGQIPTASTGLCSLSCTTFLEDTQISEPQQAIFTVRANPDRCGPVISGTVTDSNPRTIALTGDETRLIRGESTALCTINSRARCEATLVQKKIADTVLTEDVLEISAIEAESIRFLAKDSRGYTAQEIVEIPMIPYFQPVVRLQTVRKDAVSGDGKLTVEGSFYNGSFGAQKNSLHLRWRLNDGDWKELTPALDGNAFTAAADISGMDYTRSHRITLEVSDALHSLTSFGEIQPGIPVFDWSKEDFAFHVPVTIQNVEILNELLQLKSESLRRTGDTMSGMLNMNKHPVTGLPQPEATSDAVPKSYADKKSEIRKLWKNPEPVGSFAAQTLNIHGLADCDYVWINFNALNTSTCFDADLYVPKERDGLANQAAHVRYDSGVYVSSRTVTVNFETETIDFGGGYQNGSSNSNRMIPQLIMGFRGVLDKTGTGYAVQ